MIDGVLEGADLVHEAKLQSLLTSKNSAASEFVDRLLEPITTAGGDVALEDRVDVVHPGLHFYLFFLGENLGATEHGRVFAALVGLEGDADLFPGIIGGNL